MGMYDDDVPPMLARPPEEGVPPMLARPPEATAPRVEHPVAPPHVAPPQAAPPSSPAPVHAPVHARPRPTTEPDPPTWEALIGETPEHPLDLDAEGGLNGRVGEHGPYVHTHDTLQGSVIESALVDGAVAQSSRDPHTFIDISMFGEDAGRGTWIDADGVEHHGEHAHAETISCGMYSDQPGDIAQHERLEFSGPAADYSAYRDEDGLSLGLQAELGEVGFRGDSGAHPERTDDGNTHVALSEGVGAGGRVFYGDRDHDGTREIGIGADVGPFTVDVRSERLGWIYNQIAGWFSTDDEDGPHERVPVSAQARE